MLRTLVPPGHSGMDAMHVGVLVANPADAHCPARVIWSSNTLGEAAN
jgi:hypothetical protein